MTPGRLARRGLRAFLAAGTALLLAACSPGEGEREGQARRQANAAWTALAQGDLAAAEQAAEAALRGDAEPRTRGLAHFVRGNVAFARCETLEAESQRPGAPSTLAERARAYAEDALAAWRQAAVSRDDWPEARRNVERALLRVERLREKRSDGPGKPPPPRPPPRPDPAATSAPEPSPTPANVEAGALSAQEVARLLEVLREQERQKQALRRARREATGGGVERDW